MKKILMTVSVFTVIMILSSTAFAEDTAKDAMIAYSGTDTFAKLSSEERMACMMWIAEGGQMSEVCRGAATRLIAEEPDAVTPQQRRELFAATMGKVSTSKKTQPVRQSQTIKRDDNSGAIIAAGIIGVVAGMIIHNNLPRHRGHSYRPAPPPPHHHPAPPRPHRCPPPAPVRRYPSPDFRVRVAR